MWCFRRGWSASCPPPPPPNKKTSQFKEYVKHLSILGFIVNLCTFPLCCPSSVVFWMTTWVCLEMLICNKDLSWFSCCLRDLARTAHKIQEVSRLKRWFPWRLSPPPLGTIVLSSDSPRCCLWKLVFFCKDMGALRDWASGEEPHLKHERAPWRRRKDVP